MNGVLHADLGRATALSLPDDETADRALVAKAAVFAALGVRVHLCGDVPPA